VGFSCPKISQPIEIEAIMAANPVSSRINIDLIAVGIALTLAALIRFNILPPISF
jgi:uncharacterized membrane protein